MGLISILILSLCSMQILHAQQTLNPIWVFQASFRTRCVDISDDGRNIVVGSDDKNIYFLHNTSKNVIWYYPTGSAVYYVAMSRDGKYFAAYTSDGKVYFFSETSSTPIWVYDTGYHTPKGLDISDDGSYIVAGDGGGNVYLFKGIGGSGTPEWSTDISKGSIKDIAISGNGEYIVAGTSRNKVYLFRRNSKNPLWFSIVNQPVVQVDITYSGDRIVAAVYNKLYVFNKNSNQSIWMESFTGTTIKKVKISGNNQYIVVAAYGRISIYGINGGKIYSCESFQGRKDVHSIDVSYNGEYIVIGSYEYIYFVSKNSLTPIYIYHSTDIDTVYSISMSKYGKYVIVGTSSGKALFFKYVVKKSSSITISCNPISIGKGETTTISGEIIPPRPSVNVKIEYRRDGTWYILGTVTTDSNGHYTTTFQPQYTGTYHLRASWEGDNEYMGATSSEAELTVTKIVKQTSTLTISLSSTKVNKGKPVTISGQLKSSAGTGISGVTITIRITKPDGATDTLTSSTASDGTFSATYTPQTKGTYSVVATWNGNSYYYGCTSQTQQFTAEESMCPFGLSLIIVLSLFSVIAIYNIRKNR